MKKKFKTSKKRRRGWNMVLLAFCFGTSFIATFVFLLKSNFKIDDKTFVNLLLNSSGSYIETDNSILTELLKIFTNFNLSNPENILKSNYSGLTDSNVSKLEIKTENKKENKTPTIYIYNSHQTEEYAPSSFAEYFVNPTVMMTSYIIEKRLKEYGLYSMVEERKMKDILTQNNWNYASSYKASRIYMEDAKKNNESLTYFIDVHRDSLKKDKTTTVIGDKSYAKIIFLIGMENPNYEANLAFTTKLNDLMNSKYPTLSKGIYKKQGEGVNGVYNQDFSPYTILVEFGGVENTPDEVLNSALAFTEVFREVINTNEG